MIWWSFQTLWHPLPNDLQTRSHHITSFMECFTITANLQAAGTIRSTFFALTETAAQGKFGCTSMMKQRARCNMRTYLGNMLRSGLLTSVVHIFCFIVALPQRVHHEMSFLALSRAFFFCYSGLLCVCSPLEYPLYMPRVYFGLCLDLLIRVNEALIDVFFVIKNYLLSESLCGKASSFVLVRCVCVLEVCCALFVLIRNLLYLL